MTSDIENKFTITCVLLLALLSACTIDETTNTEEDEVTNTDMDAEAVLGPVFIDIQDADKVSRSDNGAFYLLGIISDNCSEIWVEAENTQSNLHDNYQLSEFVEGNTDFRYGIREDWNNLAAGDNTYTFTAICDGNQEATDTVVFTYSPPAQSYIPPSSPTKNDFVPTETYPSYFPSDSYEEYSYSDSTIEQLKNGGAYLLSTCNDTYVFLGTFGSRYDSDSIFYKYGDYGSKYSDTSVWYEYGDYGGNYSSCSAFYDYASEPPMIIVEDTIVGYLSKYDYAGSNVIDPNEVLIYAYQEFDDDDYLDWIRD